MSAACLNCAAPLSGHFCSNCGQKAGGAPASVRTLAGDLFEDVFQIEGRLWRTLVALLFFPGRLTRAWVEGKHASYSSPLRLYIVASFILFGFMSFALPRVMSDVESASRRKDNGPVMQMDGVDKLPKVPVVGRLVRRILDNFNAYRAMSPVEAGRRLGAAFAAKLWLGYAFVIPLAALLLKLLYIRRRRFWVEHVVFSLHTHAFTFLLATVAMLVNRDWLANVVLVVLAVYYWVAQRVVYRQGWFRTTVKLGMFAFGYLLIWTLGLVLVVFASFADAV